MKPAEKAAALRAKFSASLPTDVYAIAKALGIDVVSHKLDADVSGVLIVKDDTSIIGVNEDHPPTRQRFTIAHEIGHWDLHRQQSKVFVDASAVFFRDNHSADGTASQEMEANAFAAELLMPQKALRELISSSQSDTFDEAYLRHTAAEFGVSVQALTIRLTSLGLISMIS